MTFIGRAFDWLLPPAPPPVATVAAPRCWMPWRYRLCVCGRCPSGTVVLCGRCYREIHQCSCADRVRA